MIKKALNLYNKYDEIIKYLIVGALTTLVSIVSYSFFRIALSQSLLISEILSWILAVSFAYVTNKIIVFKSRNKKIIKEATSFFGARIFTLIIGIVILIILEWIFPATYIWITIAKFAQQIVILVLNYIISKIYVFKKFN